MNQRNLCNSVLQSYPLHCLTIRNYLNAKGECFSSCKVKKKLDRGCCGHLLHDAHGMHVNSRTPDDRRAISHEYGLYDVFVPYSRTTYDQKIRYVTQCVSNDTVCVVCYHFDSNWWIAVISDISQPFYYRHRLNVN